MPVRARDSLTHPALAPPAGLTEEQAAARLAECGPNELAGRRVGLVRRYVLPQVLDPLILVLVAAFALTVATGDLRDALVIALVVVLNGAVGAWQQARADQAIAALERLAAPEVAVVRAGRVRRIPAREAVPGDVALLAAGDVVPADAVLVAGPGLEVDESALTGESVPVPKVPGIDALSAGTLVTRGRGYAEINATGANSALGRIATSLSETRAAQTPLQRRLAELGRLLAVGVTVVCVGVLALGLVRGVPLEEMLVSAVSLAVAAVPESLPVVVTLALALGARRMARRHAVVRRLASVETLGSVTTLATDKTGTLTEGRMAVTRQWPVTDDGASPGLPDLLACATLCSDADGDTGLVDPTEAALMAAAEADGLDVDALRARFPRVAEVPFDVTARRMTTAHRTPDGHVLVVSKGAPEALQAAAPEPPESLVTAAATADAFAAEGLRVLAVGAARLDDLPRDLASVPLRLVGLVGLLDPPRRAARQAILDCRRAGIRPVLVTGDHTRTAEAIARLVGFGDHPTCADLGDARADVRHADVIARARPHDKLELITALQAAHEVVAMTGDGVNDAPALRRADIGVVMGCRGTEVAKQAADVVLLDDNLETLLSAVEEGRRVYANIRRFLLYALSGGLAEILLMALGPFAGLTLPLLPAQILWVNLMTHGLPGVAMGAEPGEAGALDAPPRSPQESVLGERLWVRILLLGGYLGAASLVVAVVVDRIGGPSQTMVFLTLGLLQLAVALALHTRGSRRWNFLTTAALGAMALQLLAVYTSYGHELLRTVNLSISELAVAAGVAATGWLAAKAVRLLVAETSKTRVAGGGT